MSLFMFYNIYNELFCLDMFVARAAIMSDLVTISFMEAMMERLMRPMAMVEDIQQIENNLGKQIAACTSRVDKVCVCTDKLETDMKDIRIEMENMQREIARERRGTDFGFAGRVPPAPPQAPRITRRSTTTAGLGSRVSSTSGAGPLGDAPPSKKLGPAEAGELQHKLFRLLPPYWQPRARWVEPFMKKHTVSCEDLMASAGNAKQVADAANMALARNPMRIQGSEVCGVRDKHRPQSGSEGGLRRARHNPGPRRRLPMRHVLALLGDLDLGQRQPARPLAQRHR